MAIELNISNFRANPIFAQFSNETTFPDVYLTSLWDVGSVYISTDESGPLTESQREFALQLMLAHIAFIQLKIADGSDFSVMTSGSEGSVSVGIAPPPSDDGFSWWLSATPYGKMLAALLQASAAAGFVYGGRPERSAFRKVYGAF